MIHVVFHHGSPPGIDPTPLLCMKMTVYFYKCIGANERILDHFLSRSSLPTIPVSVLSGGVSYTSVSVHLPFILDPIGSPPLLIRTHALSSNLTTLPSSLWYFLIVRTTTACLISPLLTLFAALMDTLPPGPDSGPKFLCFCTTTMMRSPGKGISCWSGKAVLSHSR